MIYSDDLQVAIMEPCKDASIEEQAANAARIVACVNGCAGLNPAAFRECVEALRLAIEKLRDEGYRPGNNPSMRTIVDALAHAEVMKEGRT